MAFLFLSRNGLLSDFSWQSHDVDEGLSLSLVMPVAGLSRSACGVGRPCLLPACAETTFHEWSQSTGELMLNPGHGFSEIVDRANGRNRAYGDTTLRPDFASR